MSVLFALFVGFLLYYLLSRVRICRGGSHPGERYPPIARVLAEPGLIRYDLKVMHGPVTTGLRFKLLVRLAFTRLGQMLLVPFIKRGANGDAMGRVVLPEKPTLYPTPPYPPPITADYTQSNRTILQKLFDQIVQTSQSDVSSDFHFPTVADYWKAYKAGQCTPTDVAEAALRAIEDSNALRPPLRAIVDTKRDVVMAMAKASTERWRNGNTLSLLDGIPIAIKSSVHVEPYEFYSGAVNVPECARGVPEAAIVQKLKDAGAIIIGIANMQEFGTGALGSNPTWRHLTARNPYNMDHYPGGSSSGSAASIAAGLCPIAIGTGGGGSVRIPSALCGVVGLKYTYGLIDLKGCLPTSQSISVSAPLCSSVLDAAIAMHIISRETDGDRTMMSLEGLGDGNLKGVKVGIYWEYFNHADEEVVSENKFVVSQLKALGAEIVDIKIPELENSRIAHLVSLLAEVTEALENDVDKYFDDLTLETLIVVAVGKSTSAIEYINAQKQRTRAIASLRHVFEKVDIILTPATACVAPVIKPAAVLLGESNLKVSSELMRFLFLANLCGNPGLVLPLGYTKSKLPISTHMLGRCYEERTLLRVGLALERSGAFPLQKPRVFYDLLKNNAV